MAWKHVEDKKNRNNMVRTVVMTIVAVAMSMALRAQEEAAPVVERYDYVKSLTDNSKSNGKIELNLDERIATLVEKCQAYARENVKMNQVAGWRVQMFSSNQQGTSKTQAEAVKEQVEARYGNLPVYVTWQSPFWKVRVGDCTSNVEAQSLREALKESFPEMASEIYIVKDKVNVPE